MLGRRLFCLHANLDRLAKQGRCYLWTFTFRDAVDYTALRKAWNRLLTYLRRRMPLWEGVRVYEVHPGKYGEFSHGLHVHVVSNRRHDAHTVWDAARAAGWGRCHVVRVKKDRLYYVSKYLAKSRPPALAGWRLHATFGMKQRTRLADIVCHSVRADLMRYVCRTFPELGWMAKQDTVLSLYHRYLQGRTSATLAIALGASHEWRGPWKGWVALTAAELAARIDPHETCWGRDVRLFDVVANRRSARVADKAASASRFALNGTTGQSVLFPLVPYPNH